MAAGMRELERRGDSSKLAKSNKLSLPKPVGKLTSDEYIRHLENAGI